MAQDNDSNERRVSTDVPRAYNSGTRYITTLGLPAHIRVTPPDWIANPATDGVLGAIGVAPRNDLGTREQLDNARRNGRMEIGHMLETRVQNVGRDDVEQHIQVTRTGAGDSLEHNNDSQKSNLGVERNITDLVLSGSRQRALWFDPSNGDCYVWLVMDGSVPGMANHTVENGVSIYVANKAVGSTYKPTWPSEPKPPEPQPEAPAPVIKTPIEKLEESLKPIMSIPVKGTAAPSKK